MALHGDTFAKALGHIFQSHPRERGARVFSRQRRFRRLSLCDPSPRARWSIQKRNPRPNMVAEAVPLWTETLLLVKGDVILMRSTYVKPFQDPKMSYILAVVLGRRERLTKCRNCDKQRPRRPDKRILQDGGRWQRAKKVCGRGDVVQKDEKNVRFGQDREITFSTSTRRSTLLLAGFLERSYSSLKPATWGRACNGKARSQTKRLGRVKHTATVPA